MREYKAQTTDEMEEIQTIAGKNTPVELYWKKGLLIAVKVDDSALTTKQKTDLDAYCTSKSLIKQ